MELLDRFFNGEGYDAYTYFGAHKLKNGYVFRVYAPDALEIELVGNFNSWDGKEHKMIKVDDRGIYEIILPNLNDDYQIYKFHIRTSKNKWIDKADPYAFYSEVRPQSGSKTFDYSAYQIKDDKYLKTRTKCFDEPLNIYEMHLGSWKRKEDGSFMSYEEIIEPLIKYLKDGNYTHIELMPICESPLDTSWGYLCSSFFSINSRYGNPSQFKYLVYRLHQENIGVILDFVPLHFIKDSEYLSCFDGSCVYESKYQALQMSPWGSMLFDFSKPEVMSFVTSALFYYLEEYNIDGVRFDAISNMIFKNGDKNLGLNDPNINWMKKNNDLIAKRFHNVMLIAEDSSDFAGVTKPTFEGGLGFDYKWDLGWMNDTLKYMKEDPLFRGDHLNLINFSMFYFYSERFLLPLSHDEVVHMKGSIINKISGEYEDKFQQLKTLYTYMFTHPGKKLNFMGNELAQFDEWIEENPLNFDILKYPIHDAFNAYFKTLCKLYIKEPALYKNEYDPLSFKFVQASSNDNVFIYERHYQKETLIIVLNFSGILFEHYRFNVSSKFGVYQEILNSDAYCYNGHNNINDYNIYANDGSIGIRVPAFGAVILKLVGEN